jgi:hypothetical protein
MYCDICNSEMEVKNFALYVHGSEGFNLCLNCQILVCRILRDLSMFRGNVLKEMYKQGKK